VARQLHHLAIEITDLLLDSNARLEQGFDRSSKFGPILD
jgi:hypothetical protein